MTLLHLAGRVARLEAANCNTPRHHVWQPDGLTDEGCAAWLAGLRKREGWPATEGVTVYRWLPEAEPTRS